MTPRLHLPFERLADRAQRLDPLTVGLVSLSLALGAGALAPLLYLQTTSRELAVEPIVTARLPHPRPAEPLITGSIDPDPLAADLETDLGRTHHRAETAEPERLKTLEADARAIARAWKECAEGAEAHALQTRSNVADRLVIRIDCGGGTSFYLDEDEIELTRRAAEPPPAAPAAPAEISRLSDGEAILACEDKLKIGLPVPASFRRSAPSTGVDRAPGDGALVTFDFDAVNGLGFPLAMQANCLFEARNLARLETTPR